MLLETAMRLECVRQGKPLRLRAGMMVFLLPAFAYPCERDRQERVIVRQ